MVYAQQTAGSITGRASAGDSVAAESASIGVSRSIAITQDGTFQISQLPPGQYKVTITRANGSKQTVDVTVGSGEAAFASFGDAQRVVVTGSAIRALDVKSSESSLTLTKAQIDRIPVARDVTAIALLAPGATFGDARIGQTTGRNGNVPSLGGASPAENAYYVGGMNVTNMVNFVDYNQLPYEAIADQSVLIGGYSAMYGRSMGGVIALTTKRGTNEWHGGANLEYQPSSLAGSSVRTKQEDGDYKWTLVDRPGSRDKITANVWGGGPIIQDQLYIFGLIQGVSDKQKVYGISQQSEFTDDSPWYMLRADWNVTKDNLLSFTTFSNKAKLKTKRWNSVEEYGTAKDNFLGRSTENSGGDNHILNWTSYITQDFTLTALAGIAKFDRRVVSDGADCPYVVDQLSGTARRLGCSVAQNTADPKEGDERKAFRLDAEWVLGKHTLKFGADIEKNKVVSGTQRSGGIEYRTLTLAPNAQLANGFVNTTGAPLQYVRTRQFGNGGSFKTENSALYVEDNWQFDDRLNLSLGVRSEGFNNKNGNGDTFIKVNSTIAPRLGLTYDLDGDAKTKIFANAGRYYIPVATNMNIRLSGAETDIQTFYNYGGSFNTDRFSLPVLGAQIGDVATISDGVVPDPRSVVDPKIKPLFQDELSIGFEKALADRWKVGVRYIHRDLKNVMDDICGGQNAYNWALASGNYTPDQAVAIRDAVDHCFLFNPGKDLTANVDLDGTGELTKVRIPKAALLLPKPKRIYDAVEVTVDRAWDKKWAAGGSYVFAKLKGNTEGYVKSDIGQDDAGITQDFDFPGLMVGSYGYLPNDRRHTLKLWGTYGITDEFSVGANLILQSGRPKNCFGTYPSEVTNPDGSPVLPNPLDVTDLPSTVGSAAYGDASFYCENKLAPRGSLGRLPWTTQLNLTGEYTPNWAKGLSFRIDVLNVFDKRTVRAIEEAQFTGVTAAGTGYGEPLLGSVTPARTVKLKVQYEF
jgi:TonB dependent receptor/TonB-dependent Receptor Plug Domain